MGGSAGHPTTLLVINELVASNDGAAVDDFGETDDFVELVNTSDEVLSLDDFAVSDGGPDAAPLPAQDLEPGERVVLWADNEPEEGELHLPLRLSADGEAAELWSRSGQRYASVPFPRLDPNDAYARFPDGEGDFSVCRYATPNRPNGDTCGPPAPPELPDDVTFQPYDWDLPYPPVTGPLVLSELGLRPADFVELANVGDSPVDLDDFALRLSPTAPGTEFPGPDDGVALALPEGETLEPGQRVVVPVTDADTEALEATDRFEGVLSLFAADAVEPIDRVDFMSWPEGAVLARQPDDTGRHVFCATATPDEPNDACDRIPSREVTDRLRHLRTPGDFTALAEGATQLGMAPVKFVVDMQHGDAVHLLSSRAWPLHYTFVREVIDGSPPLDRCDPAERSEFYSGWYAFSVTEYYDPDNRRYLQGTLVHHGGSDLHTVEFAIGDEIRGDHMRRAFFDAMEHVLDPTPWALRPQEEEQAQRALSVDGTLPIVSPNAPFSGVTYQPLTEGVGYGVLRFVPADELDETPLGFDVIVVTDDVPNDIPLVGGLITEAFQTPLAHVNVLSQSRNTPNMSLAGARDDARLSEHFDTLVRLEVRADGFTVEPADPEAASNFWDNRLPEGPPGSPRLDLSVRELQPLPEGGLDWLPFVGAKAAQLAELHHVAPIGRTGCPGTLEFELPDAPFAIPVVHSVEHFEVSGARELLESLRTDPEFNADPRVRAEGLAEVRELIQDHPVDPDLLASVEAAIEERFGNDRVRLRSSSNAEDLPGFNGAGLYTSVGAALGDPERPIDVGLKTVWASLYNARAYDERELARIDHADVAMGVLVHRAFLSERANGVAISRDVLDPERSDIYYMNAQIGEATVTNPAPGVVTEQFVYRWPPRLPPILYQTRSSLTDTPVLSVEEVERIACGLSAIDTHFKPLLDPDDEDPWFAMEVELKLLGDSRQLLFKQTRPHIFGGLEPIGDCREF